MPITRPIIQKRKPDTAELNQLPEVTQPESEGLRYTMFSQRIEDNKNRLVHQV